ncbi:hypothetical protein [Brevibacillus marinus]|uniref:hypothetical protein n=1 Tax=Brevibacillus marinus TaxID=2496837 RepID=UPI0013DFFA83|nr:hypothetical protein [Brevibacillus marinus]
MTNMNIVLTERKCRVCKTKLTEYEFEHKDGLCMDCYEELANEKESSSSKQAKWQKVNN